MAKDSPSATYEYQLYNARLARVLTYVASPFTILLLLGEWAGIGILFAPVGLLGLGVPFILALRAHRFARSLDPAARDMVLRATLPVLTVGGMQLVFVIGVALWVLSYPIWH